MQVQDTKKDCVSWCVVGAWFFENHYTQSAVNVLKLGDHCFVLHSGGQYSVAKDGRFTFFKSLSQRHGLKSCVEFLLDLE